MSENVFEELKNLSTESRNPRSLTIDRVSSLDIVKIINNEDKMCAELIQNVLDEIAQAIDLISSQFIKQGRLFYIGAGTSGRLGVLDASECPPTFGTDPSMVQGIIAGGNDALTKAQEGSEDIYNQGWIDLLEKQPTKNDVVCGIMASGRTPYVIGAIEEARKKNIPTIIISCNGKENLKSKADINICVDAGPEIIMGSTRMKSGTIQKMILNMLTTGSMIKIGKTYQNIMVDLQMNSQKLVERSKKILMIICDMTYNESSLILDEAGGHVKSAIVMHFLKCTLSEAKEVLKRNNGKIYSIIESGSI